MNITEVGDTFNCDCGFSWTRGFSGSHDCGDGLRRQIADLKVQILANLQAQPVSGECNKEVYENGQSACLVDIPKETAEVICRGISQATGCKLDWHYIGGRVHIKAIAPAAPAVGIPDKVSCEGFDPKDWVEARNLGQCEGWNAYRAELLAQPVSQGYKLVPVEPTPKQWAAGVKAMDAGMDKVTLVYKAMLATAPTKGENQ
ncbi:MAG: hypothetical protein LKJ78_10080 [Serratia liquefaciens]|jgi:hypothetical protein|nr:hypothetical protein [Serratia liquefaciens]MCH4233441.1 hypothetical protein [Serratia liquefaciens]MCH4261632.1 hypothetical protein [Serratia liquefaciens]MCI1214165.1 hypothetical protein [Serratia liquefaciens]MCI1235519.1 hypothetical protein [Serratia liquefaciens]